MDRFSQEVRSATMQAIRSKNTKPELIIRRLIHSMGYRYRLHGHDLPGRPDLIFPRKQKIIFIHGCFWHKHSDPNCKLRHIPKSNREYWLPKLKRNVMRDKKNQKQLRDMGWKILVIWECEISDFEALTNKIDRFLS